MSIRGEHDDKFWGETFDGLYQKLKKSLNESQDLSERDRQVSIKVVRSVLQETAIDFIRQAGEVYSTQESSERSRKNVYVPLDIKDLWGLSTLSTMVSYETELGRQSAAYNFDKTIPDVPSNYEMGSHPLEFVSYAFSANLSGRNYLEGEARALWADCIVAPVSGNRRYSEFFALWKDLSKYYKYRIGASSRVRLIIVPPLPSRKSLSFISGMDANFVSTRKRALDIWLRYVSLHRIMSISAPFRRFMIEPLPGQDNATVDSFSVGSIATGAFYAASTYSTQSNGMGREDPIVARRARKQVDEILARYGSGPVALSAVYGILPALQNSTHSAKLSVRNIMKKDMHVHAATEKLGTVLLSLSKTDQMEGRQENEAKLMRLDPINRLGIALKRGHSDISSTHHETVEAFHHMQHTLRLWSKYLYPKMKKHVAYLYSSDISDRQDEEFHQGVTPPERLAAEWHEMCQVRCCMLAKAAEDIVQSQIVLASKRRMHWEQLREKLERFDVDEHLQLLASSSALNSPSMGSQDGAALYDLMSADHGEEDETGSLLNAAFEEREQRIIEYQQATAVAKREEEQQRKEEWLANGGSERRAPPPIPKPIIPRRASQQAIKVTGTPAIRARASTNDSALRSNESTGRKVSFGPDVIHERVVTEGGTKEAVGEVEGIDDEVKCTESDIKDDRQTVEEVAAAESEKESNWVEAFTEDGIPYYYHAVTRQTRWVRPDKHTEEVVEKRIQQDTMDQEERQQRRLRELQEQRERDIINEERRNEIAGTLDKQVEEWKSKNSTLADLIISLPNVAGDLPGFVNPIDNPQDEERIRSDVPFRKRIFKKAVRCVHPDKMQSHPLKLENVMRAERIFSVLMEACNCENSEQSL